MDNMEYANPWVLWLLLLLPVLAVWRLFRRTRQLPTVLVPSIKAFAPSGSWVVKLRPILSLLRLVVIGLIILALARPRTVKSATQVDNEKGVDIMMVVDVSLSMLAKDLKPDRLTALKNVAQEFIQKRMTDRIGIVAYSGEAITRVPLTVDKAILSNATENLQTDELYPGTAIGVGLATGLHHLRESEAKSKVVILITDGVESVDFSSDLLYVSPVVAAEIAKQEKVKVYTIGVGTNGFAAFPVGPSIVKGEYYFEKRPVEIDEEILKQIAKTTGGKYFRATDNKTLSIIYDEINELEKSEVNSITFYQYTERYAYFLFPAFLLFLFELLLRATAFKEFV